MGEHDFDISCCVNHKMLNFSHTHGLYFKPDYVYYVQNQHVLRIIQMLCRIGCIVLKFHFCISKSQSFCPSCFPIAPCCVPSTLLPIPYYAFLSLFPSTFLLFILLSPRINFSIILSVSHPILSTP